MLSGHTYDGSDISFSTSSSEEELMQQALPVDDYGGTRPPDVSKIFLCPNEYLRYVRLEAAKLPQTLTSPMCLSDRDKVEFHETPKQSIPSQDVSTNWKHIQAKRFTESQAEFDYLVRQLYPSRKFESSAKQLVTALSSGSRIDWLVSNPPLLSHFVGLSQTNISILLEALIPACSPKIWNGALQPWVYGALLALERPLLPDTCFTLRQIGKKFRKHFKRESPNDKWRGDKPLGYLIVTIIGIVFGQRDLLEDV